MAEPTDGERGLSAGEVAAAVARVAGAGAEARGAAGADPPAGPPRAIPAPGAGPARAARVARRAGLGTALAAWLGSAALGAAAGALTAWAVIEPRLADGLRRMETRLGEAAARPAEPSAQDRGAEDRLAGEVARVAGEVARLAELERAVPERLTALELAVAGLTPPPAPPSGDGDPSREGVAAGDAPSAPPGRRAAGEGEAAAAPGPPAPADGAAPDAGAPPGPPAADGSPRAPPVPAAGPPPAARYAIHLASVRDAADVPAEWRRLVARDPGLAGLEPRPPQRVEIAGKGAFWRVLAGAFPTRAEAGAACGRARARGRDCSVVALRATASPP